MLLYIQCYWLKHASPSLRYLPPLEQTERFLFALIAVGWGFLTLGLLTGIIFLEERHQHWLSAKFLLSLLAWSIFALLLWGRHRFGWRGQRAVKLTLIGMVLLLLSYLFMRVF